MRQHALLSAPHVTCCPTSSGPRHHSLPFFARIHPHADFSYKHGPRRSLPARPSVRNRPTQGINPSSSGMDAVLCLGINVHRRTSSSLCYWIDTSLPPRPRRSITPCAARPYWMKERDRTFLGTLSPKSSDQDPVPNRAIWILVVAQAAQLLPSREHVST